MPRAEKEEFYKVVANGFFLEDTQRHQWPVIDQTYETEHGDSYHQLLIWINDQINYWFCNLCLLQLRIGLGLTNTYYSISKMEVFPFSTILAKIQSIEFIVGREQLGNSHIPEMRAPSNRLTRPVFQNIATDAICDCGLCARARPLGNQ